MTDNSKEYKNMNESYEKLKVAYNMLLFNFEHLSKSYQFLKIDYNTIVKSQDSFFDELREIHYSDNSEENH